MQALWRFRSWQLLAILAAGIAIILFGIDYYRHRFVRSSPDMLRLLPQGDMSIFFADVSALRRGGMLRLLAGSTQAQDKDYQEFVRQTHFDYTRNIDEIAGAADRNQLFFIVRGHFDWGKLREYAVTHQGECAAGLCSVPGSKNGSWASFVAIQPNVLGLAVSANRSAADVLRPPAHRGAEAMPGHPVWVKASHALLQNPFTLPLPLRIFAISLQSAEVVVLSLAPTPENSQAAFRLELTAQCPNRATAETIRSQLEIQTRMLRRELAREHERPNPADLTGLLTDGSFHVDGKVVKGIWPVRKELLKTLE